MIKFFFSLLLTFGLVLPAHACSLFAVTGNNYVEGGGSLAFKNTDWRGASQSIHIVKPSPGNKYICLYRGKNNYCVGGINEKGLFVARSQASSIPKAELKAYPRWKSLEGLRLAEYLLRYFSSVEECVSSKIYAETEPLNLLVVDSKEAAYIEIAPDKTFVVRKINAGPIFHTNHYLEDEIIDYNKHYSKSSHIRYNRLAELVQFHQGQYTFQEIIAMTKDRAAGRNNSIYRVGDGKPNSTKTVGSFAVHIKPDGDADIFIRYQAKANDTEQEELIESYQLQEILSKPAGKISPR